VLKDAHETPSEPLISEGERIKPLIDRLAAQFPVR
jgi:hypothetical protein